MFQLRWLMRAKRWAQNPPSPQRVKLVLGIIVLCIALLVIERLFGVPDWMVIEPINRPKV